MIKYVLLLATFLYIHNSLAITEKKLFECNNGSTLFQDDIYVTVFSEAEKAEDLYDIHKKFNERGKDKDDKLFMLSFKILGHGKKFFLVTGDCEPPGIAAMNAAAFKMKFGTDHMRTIKVYPKRNAWNEYWNWDKRRFDEDSSFTPQQYFEVIPPKSISKD